jgi:hypothetical protein
VIGVRNDVETLPSFSGGRVPLSDRDPCRYWFSRSLTRKDVKGTKSRKNFSLG